jgi:hypothetical protein
MAVRPVAGLQGFFCGLDNEMADSRSDWSHMRYYFKVRDGEKVSQDEEGIEFASEERAWLEAAYTLSHMVRDFMPHRENGNMAIEVSNDEGHLMAVRVEFRTDR